jgi:hypothetical protein
MSSWAVNIESMYRLNTSIFGSRNEVKIEKPTTRGDNFDFDYFFLIILKKNIFLNFLGHKIPFGDNMRIIADQFFRGGG